MSNSREVTTAVHAGDGHQLAEGKLGLIEDGPPDGRRLTDNIIRVGAERGGAAD